MMQSALCANFPDLIYFKMIFTLECVRECVCLCVCARACAPETDTQREHKVVIHHLSPMNKHINFPRLAHKLRNNKRKRQESKDQKGVL